MLCRNHHVSLFFFFNDTATTEIYTLSLHDALPISRDDTRLPGVAHAVRVCLRQPERRKRRAAAAGLFRVRVVEEDRKSTRLNSSHLVISYAVFCLKKKKLHITRTIYCRAIQTAPAN